MYFHLALPASNNQPITRGVMRDGVGQGEGRQSSFDLVRPEFNPER